MEGRDSVIDLTRNCLANFSNLMQNHQLEKCLITLEKKVTAFLTKLKQHPDAMKTEEFLKLATCAYKLESFVGTGGGPPSDHGKLFDKFNRLQASLSKAEALIKQRVE